MVVAGLIGLLPVLAHGSGGVPTFVQEHFRWRSDDGAESTATWKSATDTVITNVARTQNIRLRFAVANTSTAYTGSLAPRLEYSTSTTGTWTPVSTTANGALPFEMTSSANFANGDATTQLLGGSGNWVAGRMVELPSNTSASVSFSSNQFSNFEFCFRATAKAAGSSSYCFRIGGLNSYNQYPLLTMAPGAANEAPAVVSPLTVQGIVLVPFAYSISASGTEPITYGASNLPAGLYFDGTNAIRGTPAQSGTFNITLIASSAFGSDTRTLVLTVPANNPPVANAGSASIQSGTRTTVSLSSSDSDVGQTRTYHLVSAPSHGTIEPQTAGATWYYTPARDYVGSDSFTWRCFDGVAYSGTATY
ncbi:MAG: hypothetical protein C0404_11860, partial [Verrucomicrobia bacterium]|nr:hypothetical protein [Verrucomicrobiota bacterium]